MNINQDLTTFDFHRKRRMHERLTRLMLSRRHIELKAVPRARDDAAGEFAFAERPALMRADAVESVKSPCDIEQRDDPVTGDILTALAGRKLAFCGDSNPVGHECILSHAAGRWTSLIAGRTDFRFRRLAGGTSFQRSCSHQ